MGHRGSHTEASYIRGSHTWLRILAEIDLPLIQLRKHCQERSLSFIEVAGEMIEHDSNFMLFLQTKLSNPHYKPEVFARAP